MRKGNLDCGGGTSINPHKGIGGGGGITTGTEFNGGTNHLPYTDINVRV